MKNTSTLLLAILFSATGGFAPAFSQQTSFLDAYSLQPGLFNPAAQGGAGSGYSVAVAYRAAYLDLPDKDDRPATFLLNADLSPLLGMENVGLGVFLMSDQLHVTKRTQATGFFAYHLLPEGSFQVSLGAMAGVLNQKFDFAGRRVNDPNDLALFSGSSGKTKFDGGLGAQAKYEFDNGSQVRFNLAAPQLFTSDQPVGRDSSATTGAEGSFDMLPHVLSTASYRHQFEGFALEPSVAFRRTLGGKKCNCGAFDFNLAAWFLEGDRFMVGGGIRTDGGGIRALVGVKPVENLQVTGSYTAHGELGASFEGGVRYTFGGGCGKTLTPEEEKISTSRAVAESAHTTAFSTAAGVRDKISIAKSHVKDAEAAASYEVKEEKIAKAEQYARQSEEALGRIKLETRRAFNALGDGEKALGAASRKPCNAADLDLARKASADTRAIEMDIAAKLDTLKRRMEAARPKVNLKMWVQNGETDVLKTYFGSMLGDLQDKPEDARLENVTATASTVTLPYAYSEEVEEYSLAKASMSQVKSLAGHLAANIQMLAEEDVQVEALRIRVGIEYSEQGAKFSVKPTYAGEYGAKAQVAHKLNGKSKTSTFETKKPALNYLDLAVLKAHDLKQELSAKTGIPADKIQVEVVTSSKSPGVSVALDLKR